MCVYNGQPGLTFQRQNSSFFPLKKEFMHHLDEWKEQILDLYSTREEKLKTALTVKNIIFKHIYHHWGDIVSSTPCRKKSQLERQTFCPFCWIPSGLNDFVLTSQLTRYPIMWPLRLFHLHLSEPCTPTGAVPRNSLRHPHSMQNYCLIPFGTAAVIPACIKYKWQIQSSSWKTPAFHPSPLGRKLEI